MSIIFNMCFWCFVEPQISHLANFTLWKNWYQFFTAREKLVPIRHIFHTNISHFVNFAHVVKLFVAYMRNPHIDKIHPKSAAFCIRFQFFTYILNSKRNAYYSISNKYQKTWSKFTLNYMNMFDWTRAFNLGHFIYHYTVDYYILLIDAKTQKNSAVHWKSHVLNPILLHVTTTQCNKYENSIKLLKFNAMGIVMQIQKSSFFHFLHWSWKTIRIVEM